LRAFLPVLRGARERKSSKAIALFGGFSGDGLPPLSFDSARSATALVVLSSGRARLGIGYEQIIRFFEALRIFEEHKYPTLKRRTVNDCKGFPEPHLSKKLTTSSQ